MPCVPSCGILQDGCTTEWMCASKVRERERERERERTRRERERRRGRKEREGRGRRERGERRRERERGERERRLFEVMDKVTILWCFFMDVLDFVSKNRVESTWQAVTMIGWLPSVDYCPPIMFTAINNYKNITHSHRFHQVWSKLH